MDLSIGQVKNNYGRDNDGMIRYGKRDDSRLVIPATMREEVLESNHDYVLAGHGGIGKTYAKVSRTYFWPNMHDDVVQYCKRCHFTSARKTHT